MLLDLKRNCSDHFSNNWRTEAKGKFFVIVFFSDLRVMRTYAICFQSIREPSVARFNRERERALAEC
jgi:hypothetical protein